MASAAHHQPAVAGAAWFYRLQNKGEMIQLPRCFPWKELEGKSSNIQAPTSRETSITKFQNPREARLMFGAWNFSGAWMLALGASCLFAVFVSFAAQTNAQSVSNGFWQAPTFWGKARKPPCTLPTICWTAL